MSVQVACDYSIPCVEVSNRGNSWNDVPGNDQLSAVPVAGANPWVVGGRRWHVVNNPGVHRMEKISSAVQAEEQYWEA